MAICPTAIKLIAEILKNRRKYYSVQVFMGGETRTMSLCPALINQKTIAAKRNRDSSFLFDLSHSFVYNVFWDAMRNWQKSLPNKGLLPRDLICRDMDETRDARTVHLLVK